jgi:hypothetical protein
LITDPLHWTFRFRAIFICCAKSVNFSQHLNKIAKNLGVQYR